MICLPATSGRGEGYKPVMPVAPETYSLGAPVEIGKIEQELKKLWQEGEGAMTRASLMNLAVYSEKPGSLNNNTQLMARITENHACRALVIEADCRDGDDQVSAWISAHCHMSSVGSKQVCSEQISFLLKADAPHNCQASSSPISIRTCRFVFGGRKNSAIRWIPSSGRGSIA